MTIQVTSSAFGDGERIPAKFTCDREDISPPLRWSGVPEGTQSLALIMDDPDAPVGTWVHWVLYDLSSALTALPEGLATSPTLPGIGVQGVNDFRRSGYGGPCPPRGSEHRYFFKLYALDAALNLGPGKTKPEVEKAMRGHILAQGQLMGRYGR